MHRPRRAAEWPVAAHNSIVMRTRGAHIVHHDILNGLDEPSGEQRGAMADAPSGDHSLPARHGLLPPAKWALISSKRANRAKMSEP